VHQTSTYTSESQHRGPKLKLPPLADTTLRSRPNERFAGATFRCSSNSVSALISISGIDSSETSRVNDGGGRSCRARGLVLRRIVSSTACFFGPFELASPERVHESLKCLDRSTSRRPDWRWRQTRSRTRSSRGRCGSSPTLPRMGSTNSPPSSIWSHSRSPSRRS